MFTQNLPRSSAPTAPRRFSRAPVRIANHRTYTVVLYPGAANERPAAEVLDYMQAVRLAVAFQAEGIHADVMSSGPDGRLTTEF